MKKIGRRADEMGYKAYLVGGAVRDLILGKKNFDIDITVEGNAIKLGEALAKEFGAGIVAHRGFGTCTLTLRDKHKIDLASARKEIYKKPAALPRVEFSCLDDDLERRDFTINAMAISISGADFGRLIDICGGKKDIRLGRIRILHDRSFIDDPTRVFRAVRFEQRFGFKIDPHTERLIRDAVKKGMFGKLSSKRVHNEMKLILKEDEPVKAVRRIIGFEMEIT